MQMGAAFVFPWAFSPTRWLPSLKIYINLSSFRLIRSGRIVCVSVKEVERQEGLKKKHEQRGRQVMEVEAELPTELENEGLTRNEAPGERGRIRGPSGSCPEPPLLSPEDR